ncbi:MAG: PAS domain S-box protein [Cyanobacteria bacterium J06635_15]
MFPHITALAPISLKSAIIRRPLIVSPETTVMAAIAKMSEVRLSGCMSANGAHPHPIPSPTAAEPLASRCLAAQSSCVLVVEDEQLVGLLTEQDVVQLGVQQIPLNGLAIHQVMTHPVITLREPTFTDLLLAIDLLHHHQIHHLPILDKQNHLLGMVTYDSLRQALDPVRLYDLAQGLGKKVRRLEAEKVTLLENQTVELRHQVEVRTAELKARAEREKLLTELSTQIRSSLSLHTILETTVAQVRHVLGCDRVNIWRFETDWHAIVVAESTDLPVSLVGERIDNAWFKQEPTEIYHQGRIQVVPDIDTVELSADHRALLIRLQTRSKILVPLMCGTELWGLLNATESQQARNWHPAEIELLQALSLQLAIALQQAITHEQLQLELSERRQAEARLRESEQRYASLAAAAPVGIFRTNASGQCIYVNERWSQITGLTPDSSVGEGWQQGLHPDDRDSVATEWAQSVQGRHPFQLEYRFRRADGVVTWVYGQFIAEWNTHGHLIGYLGTITDISDRKQAEKQLQQLNQGLETKVAERTAALQEREARYRALRDKASDAILVADLQGNLLEVNRKAEELLGYSREQLTQMNQSQLCTAEDLERFNATFLEVVAGTQTQTLNARLMRQDGQVIRVDITATIVNIGDTSIIQGIFRDITERHKTQQQLTERNQQLAITNEELARATRLKDEFLANMSHELRTPLNTILGMTEGLQEAIFGDLNTDQHKALQAIKHSGSHLLALINDILDVAKIESGQMDLNRTATDVASLCQSGLAFITRQALKKRIRVETELPPHLPDLWVDERRIIQVLINLLNNAVKFTPEGGRITLAVSRPQPSANSDAADSLSQNYLRIAVIDTGIGIAPDDINKLFQPFIQIDSALNRNYEGTGLGLALVKRIVECHGGQVGLTSQVGGGSHFTIDLPCEDIPLSTLESFPQGESGLEPSQLAPMASPSILLIEDNAAYINTVSSYLRAKGYRILLAKNGAEAITVAQAKTPDLIVMDIQIPGIDGLETIHRIRCNSTLANVPIIALTAPAMTSDRDRCLAAGANDYLSKPVKLRKLVNTIQQFLYSPSK